MLNLGGVRDSAEFTRRLGITLALLIVYRLGTFVPLPGIAPEALARLGGVAERISIFALSITPYVTILILAELLKVVAPGVRRWERASERNRTKLNRILVGLSLLAAAAQASGLSLALEDVKGLVSEPGTSFRLICIATLVGATAIVIWLADQITRHGLGSGVWVLLATGWLALIPSHTAGILLQLPWQAAVMQLVLGWGTTTVILAAIVTLIRAGGTILETATTCLWSRLLADAVWPWVILALALIAGGGVLGGGFWANPGNPALLLVLVGLVALFTHLYVRARRLSGTTVPAVAPAVLGGGLAIIVAAELVLPIWLHLGLAAPLIGHLVVVAAVAMSLLQRWWQPPFALDTRNPVHEEA
jgi:hypothetical protein